ncbi:MAG TPA: hydrogenase nickel incorporation protein HypB [Methylococcus sp.]|nr:hydrogenase nickel incorporation protein HypB [Methylococcus sp.]
MCGTCGCSEESVHLNENRAAILAPPTYGNLLRLNDLQAERNRQLLDRSRVLALNLMSAPGSGKTSLLEATIRALQDSLRIAVIEGDLETENDALRIRALGVDVYQITTGTACHLDARLISRALQDLDLERLDLLFIENVGNLVCPASFDLGHHRNVVLLATTEGDDKPAKYPVLFRTADVVVINKTDLLPFLDDFSIVRATDSLRNLASHAPMFSLSAKTGADLQPWLDWLEEQVAGYRALHGQGKTLRPSFPLDHRKNRAPTELRFIPVTSGTALG